MQEIFPLLAGIAIALMVRRSFDTFSRTVALAVCSIAFGVIASFISGELFVSWFYLATDTTLVLLSAGATLVLIDRRWIVRLRQER